MSDYDSKRNSIRLQTIDTKSLVNFGWSGNEVFIYKKIEKLVAALYLVSHLVKDTESFKKVVRENALNLLKTSSTLGYSPISEKDLLIKRTASLSAELVSLLDIATVSQLISPMNAGLLKSEFLVLLEALEDEATNVAASSKYVLSHEFFDVERQSTDSPRTPALHKKDHSAAPNKTGAVSTRAMDSSVKSPARRAVILDMLKRQSGLTIRDFAAVITDCSEKTVQRELIGLVQEGILVKEGERRWSSYSLLPEAPIEDSSVTEVQESTPKTV